MAFAQIARFYLYLEVFAVELKTNNFDIVINLLPIGKVLQCKPDNEQHIL